MTIVGISTLQLTTNWILYVLVSTTKTKTNYFISNFI